MSQENVEVVRRFLALLSQGDEAAWDEMPPEFVFDFSRRLIDPVVLRGRDEMRAWMERERQMSEGDHVGFEPKELIDAGDKVLALVRVSARGKASGVPVEAHVWAVCRFSDGKLVEWTYFGDDRAAAFEAVGLSEQDVHADS
jgi:ketosteroid isomerase-like protein